MRRWRRQTAPVTPTYCLILNNSENRTLYVLFLINICRRGTPLALSEPEDRQSPILGQSARRQCR